MVSALFLEPSVSSERVNVLLVITSRGKASTGEKLAFVHKRIAWQFDNYEIYPLLLIKMHRCNQKQYDNMTFIPVKNRNIGDMNKTEVNVVRGS